MVSYIDSQITPVGYTGKDIERRHFILKDHNMTQREITQGSITRVLVVGFSLVIILLLFGGAATVRNITSIQENADTLVKQQLVARSTVELLDDEQNTISAVFYNLMGDPDAADAVRIDALIRKIDDKLKDLSKLADGNVRQKELWGELGQASIAFCVEASRLSRAGANAERTAESGRGSKIRTARDNAVRELFRRHEMVVSLISKLMSMSFDRVQRAQESINTKSEGLIRESITLLGTSLAFALICSLFTVRMTRELFRNMAWQESELTRVSWHMLADQESIARRFSHEHHDELGQTLAALKANLTALMQSPANTRRIDDSVNLTDDAIKSVRSLSQLLRPIILDDFGLDAGLRWLCEGFTQRTGIAVDVASNLESRLPDEMETHLFRIAQEALTNIARHSGATRAELKLDVGKGRICFALQDNGRGIGKAAAESSGQSLGMTGMRARARAVGGVFRVSSPRTGGLRVEAEIPWLESRGREPNESHTYSAG